MKKLLAVLFLLAALGLGALGVFMYFGTGEQERCERYRSRAIELLEQAHAAQGTPKAAELAEEARSESAVAEVVCANASQERQRAILAAGGAAVSMLLFVLMLVISRKRKA